MNDSHLLHQIRLALAETLHVVKQAVSTKSSDDQRPQLDSLEERVLYSATPIAVVAEAAAVEAQEAEVATAEQSESSNGNDGQHDTPADDSWSSYEEETGEVGTFAETADSTWEQQQSTLELVFVDQSVDNYESLVSQFQAEENNGRQFEVVYLSSEQDGIGQITEHLAERSDIRAIHLVTHGNSFGLQIGTTQLSSDSVASHESQIRQWETSLTDSADILIYGCDLASSLEGQQLVSTLADWSQADVAASDDRTGHEVFGGDWELEYEVGDVDESIGLFAQTPPDWEHYLESSTWSQDGTVPASFEVNEDEWTTLDLAGLNFVQSGDPTEQATLEIVSQQLGSFQIVNDPSITATIQQGRLTLTGTASDLNIFLESSDAIQYLQAELNQSGAAYDQLTATLIEPGSSIALGDIVVNVSALNDDPTWIENLPSSFVVTEDQATALDLSSLQLSDVDVANGLMRVTLSTTTGGQLTANSSTGITISGDPTSVVLTGTEADLNSYFSDPSNIQYQHATANLNGASADSIAIYVNDLGNEGAGGGGELLIRQVAVDITAVNDAATNIGSLPSSVTVDEDVSSPLDFSQIEVTDIDDPNAVLTLSFATSNGGELFANSGGGVSVSGSGTSTIQLSGTAASLNSYLDIATSISFLHPTEHLNGTAADSIAVSLDDNGNVGSGGSHVTSLGTVDVDITAINDAATNIGSLPSSVVAVEDTVSGLDFTSIALLDVDDTNALLSLTFETSSGGLLYASASAGVVVSGDATGSLTLTGTAGAINAYLDDANAIRYLHATEHLNGNSVDSISLSVDDNGNVGSGGNHVTSLGVVDLNITAVNDAATNIGSLPSSVTVDEDVSSPLDFSQIEVTDIDDPNAVLTLSFATTNDGELFASSGGGVSVSGSGSSTIQLSGTAAAINSYLDIATSISFLHPTEHLNGTAADSISVSLDDNGNVGTGGNHVTSLGNVIVDINAVNDAPEFDGSAEFVLEGVRVNEGFPQQHEGTSIESLLGSAGMGDPILDVDAGAIEGIAISGANQSHGQWWFTTDDGMSWQAVGSISESNALLLAADGSTRVFFEPALDFNGNIEDALTFFAWDQSTGANGSRVDASIRGGTTAFSQLSKTADQLVNDAPDLDSDEGYFLETISEDDWWNSGHQISEILSSTEVDAIFDVNAGAVEGIAITGIDSGNSRWQYSTDNGATWVTVSNVSESNALLLRDTDRLRFEPDNRNGTTASITFRAWDQTIGDAGSFGDASNNGWTSPFSSQDATADIYVYDVNDAPYITGDGLVDMDGVRENAPAPTGAVGTLVSDLVDYSGPNSNVVDVDHNSVLGIALTQIDSTHGTWWYSTDGGQNWQLVDDVQDNDALLLSADSQTRLYFEPDDTFNGLIEDAANFRIWDQSYGSNGAYWDASWNGWAFAVSHNSGSISQLVNDSPILDNSESLTFSTITEDEVNNSGNSVAELLASNGGDVITDVNTGAIEGIALVGTDNGNGHWEYSLDGGTTWTDVGSVSNSNSLLLRDSDRLRFYPDEKNGTSASVSFRAWDQATGTAGQKVSTSTNGGTTPYSSAIALGTIDVTDVNDAPVLDSGESPELLSVLEDAGTPDGAVGSLVSELVRWSNAGGSLNNVGDVDHGAELGIAITNTNDTNGTWWFSTDNGSTWSEVGSVADHHALLLANDGQSRIYFEPDAEYYGTINDAITFRAWDQSTGTNGDYADTSLRGTVYAFSSSSDVARQVVQAVNDTPILSSPSMSLETDEQVPLALQGLGYQIQDIDENGLGVLVTMQVTQGLLDVNVGDSGVTIVSGNQTGSVQLTGTVAQLNQLLTGSGTGTFAYLNDQDAPDSSVNLTVTVNDQGNYGIDPGLTGGSNDEQAQVVTSIQVNAINDDPYLAQSPADSVSVVEDQVSNLDLSSIQLRDVDSDDSVLQITLTTSTGGEITVSGAGGIIVSGTSQAVTLTGSQSALNDLLSNSSSFQYLHSVANLNGSAADSVSIEICDLGNYGEGGGATLNVGQIDIDIVAVNDAAVNEGTMPSSLTVTEDISSNLDFSTIQVSDLDDPNAVLTLVFSSTSGGQLSASSQGGVTVSGSGTDTLRLSGTAASLNGFVSNVSSLNYLHSVEHTYGTPADSIVATLEDNGNVGTGGNLVTALGTVDINITAVNDAPTHQLPALIEGTEDTKFAVAGISIDDVDIGISTMQVELSVQAGILEISPYGDVVIVSGSNSSAALAIQGTLADINQTLQTLHYQADANLFGTNVDQLTISTSDLGGFGTGGALTTTDQIQIDIAGVNDVPEVLGLDINQNNSIAINENFDEVFDLVTADVDDSSVDLDIVGGSDAARFVIDPTTGKLKFSVAPDFENATDSDSDNVYEVEIRVQDGSGGESRYTLLVGVDDVNEAPELTTDNSAAELSVDIDENQADVIQLTSQDEDRPNDVLTYSISGGLDGALFSVDQQGFLTFNSSPDFENPTDHHGVNVYEVIVSIADEHGLSDSQRVLVTVNEVNEAPEIVSEGGVAIANIDRDEGETFVATVQAIDEDQVDTVLSFSIAGGPDSSLFVIDPATGALSFVASPNHENPTDADLDGIYEVDVQVNDPRGGSDTQRIRVSISDVNDAPTITSSNGLGSAIVSVDENTESILHVTANDEDSWNTSLTFEIIGGADADKVAIDAVTGELMFLEGADYESPSDFDQDGTYEIIVSVTDDVGATDFQQLFVVISDVNEAPKFLHLSEGINDLLVEENQAEVLQLLAFDTDGFSSELQFAVAGGADAGLFVIDANGRLSFVVAPDFEVPMDADLNGVYEIEVVVRDADGLSSFKTLRIHVTNAPDTPPRDIDESRLDQMRVETEDVEAQRDSMSGLSDGAADASLEGIHPSDDVRALNSRDRLLLQEANRKSQSFEVEVGDRRGELTSLASNWSEAGLDELRDNSQKGWNQRWSTSNLGTYSPVAKVDWAMAGLSPSVEEQTSAGQSSTDQLAISSLVLVTAATSLRYGVWLARGRGIFKSIVATTDSCRGFEPLNILE